MKNKVCVGIITYNIDEKIIKVVNSIVDQVDSIVIVDNASENYTFKILDELSKSNKINVIFNMLNVGIAKALNQAVKYAKNNNFDWILTLDHDSVCDENMIKDMLQCAVEYKNIESVGILTPKIYEINKKDYISKKGFGNKKFIKVNDCIQSGSLIKLDVFDKVGCFNEDLFIYHVDFDFCQRLLKYEYDILQCNNVTLFHEEGYKTPKFFCGIKAYYNNYSYSAIYYITRNTIYMCKKYNVFYFKRIVKDFVYITLFDKERNKKLFFLSKGLHDGLFNIYGKLE